MKCSTKVFFNEIKNAINEMKQNQGRLYDKTKEIELCESFLTEVKDILCGYDGELDSRPAFENYETLKEFCQHLQQTPYEIIDREFIAICADLRALRAEEKRFRKIEEKMQGYTTAKRGFSFFRTVLWLVLLASVILIGFGAFKSANQSLYEQIGFWIDAIGLLIGVIAFIAERYSDSKKARDISEKCNISIVDSQIVKGCFNFAVFHSKTNRLDDNKNK